MSYTAKQRFPTWYSKVDLNVSKEIIAHRLEAITDILEEEEENFWENLVHLYFNVQKEILSTQTEKLIEYFVVKDGLFPIENNENVVRSLASMVLCFKLEEEYSDLNYQLSLAIVNGNFLGQYDVSHLNYTLEFAKNNIEEATKAERSSGSTQDNLNDITQSLNSKVDDDEEGDEVSALTNSEVLTIVESLNNANRLNSNLKEETDVFWWIFGEFSSLTHQTFQKNGLNAMVSIAPIELFNITRINYGLIAAKQYLNKVLMVSNGGKSHKNISVYDVVNSTLALVKESLLKDWESKISYLTPCLLALSTSNKYEESQDWSPLYKTASNKANVKASFAPYEISYQIYNELLFLNII